VDFVITSLNWLQSWVELKLELNLISHFGLS